MSGVRVCTFSRQTNVYRGAWEDSRGTIWYSENGSQTRVMRAEEIRIPGVHNVENYLAAISAVWGLVSVESIRKAFDQALLICGSRESLWEENRFLRALIRGQISQTVVFDQAGNLFLSTLDAPVPELLDMLRRELPESQRDVERRITRNLGGMLYAIRIRQVAAGSAIYTAFFLEARKTPLSPQPVGHPLFLLPGGGAGL